MTDREIWLVYSTFPTREEALFAARALVEERLAACAHVQSGVTSVYRWEGQMQQEEEAVLTLKTGTQRLEPAMARIKALHSYTLPCIVAFPLTQGFTPYFDWVKAETA